MEAVEPRLRGSEIDRAEAELAALENKVGKENADICPALDSLAELLHADGLYAKAELLYKRSLDLKQKKGDAQEVATALHRLGLIYRIQNKFDDAEAIYLKALAVAQDLHGSDDRAVADRLSYLAGMHNARQEFSKAETLLCQALPMYDKAFGRESFFSGMCCLAIALMCKKQGKEGDAAKFFERSREATKCDTTAGEGSDARSLMEVAQLYFEQERFGEAELLLRYSVTFEEERLWPQHPMVAEALHARAELFRAQGKTAEAEKLFKRALDIRERALGCAHSETGYTAMALATMYLNQGRFADAEPMLKHAMKIRVRAFGVHHPSVAACIESYAVLLKRTKRVTLANKLDARARDIRTTLVAISDKKQG